MDKPNVLIIVDRKESQVLDGGRQSNHWNVFWLITDYNTLYKKCKEIEKTLVENNIDFVLYSRNDQVANRTSIGSITRRLRTGYSSFSGIDKEQRLVQMGACFQDFMTCDKMPDLDAPYGAAERVARDDCVGKFSLIFDTEQLGCVLYGLPRILLLLQEYNVRATFFVTNLIKKVYANVLNELRRQGHEVGIHGLWHEYLSDLNLDRQRESVRKMKQDFESKVSGANFMSRMNMDTIQALAEEDIRYFMQSATNYYRWVSYPKPTPMPSLVHLPNRTIWTLPVCVETYNRPWYSIKNMVDSALLDCKSNQFCHISILCHPFRDGNLAHINTTKRLLQYLVDDKRLEPNTLEELASSLLESDISFPEISREDVFESKSRFSPPKTRQDVFGFIPENLVRLWSAVRKGHGIL